MPGRGCGASARETSRGTHRRLGSTAIPLGVATRSRDPARPGIASSQFPEDNRPGSRFRSLMELAGFEREAARPAFHLLYVRTEDQDGPICNRETCPLGQSDEETA